MKIKPSAREPAIIFKDIICVLPHIASFLPNPHSAMSAIDKNCEHVFKTEFPLNVLVSERIRMPELKCFKGCDDELEQMLSYSYLNRKEQDPKHFFQVIAIDVLNKNFYDRLKAPLVQALLRIYENFNQDSKDFSEMLEKYFTSIGNYEMLAKATLSDITKVGDKIMSMNLNQVKELCSQILAMESNFLTGLKHNLSLFSMENQVFTMGFVFIFGAPQEFFTEIFITSDIDFIYQVISISIQMAIKSNDRITSYERIGNLMNWFENVYLTPAQKADEDISQIILQNRLLARICLQDFDQVNFYESEIVPSNMGPSSHFILTWAALSVEKMKLYDFLFNDNRHDHIIAEEDQPEPSPILVYGPHFNGCIFIVDIINKMKDQVNIQNIWIKLFFRVIINLDRNDRIQIFWYLKHYALDNIEDDGNGLIITMKTTAEGLPEVWSFHLDYEFNKYIITPELPNILKVTNADVLVSLFTRCPEINLERFQAILPSFDIVKHCLESETLFNTVISMGIKIFVDANSLLELLNQNVNLEKLPKIMHSISNSTKPALLSIKKPEHFAAIERFTSMDIAHLFFDWFGFDLSENYYGHLRNIIKYWVSSDECKHQISLLSSLALKQMVKIDFPEEAADILLERPIKDESNISDNLTDELDDPDIRSYELDDPDISASSSATVGNFRQRSLIFHRFVNLF